LIFPHHENEIAQSEAYTGKKPVVKYWLHCGLLAVNGEKMSKSLGNIISIENLLHRYEADVIRLYTISTHYRRPINFVEADLDGAKQKLARIQGTIENLHEQIDAHFAVKEKKTGGQEFRKQVQVAKEKFLDAMDDDFNTPRALAAFYRAVQIGNKALATTADSSVLTEVLNVIKELAQIFGILQMTGSKEELPEEAEKLLKERVAARSRKEWGKADELRKKLREMRIIVEDLPEGTRWKYEE
ncbi:MAG: DALR domain-containing protein, partial [Candidatus Bathyarchaeota archaeon]